MLVYILSDYEEQGAENVQATLRPELLPAMIDEWPTSPSSPYGYSEEFLKAHRTQWASDAKQALAALLAREPHTLVDPDGHNLHRGWGGAMLHVVELKDG